jgi:hypothetical protein
MSLRLLCAVDVYHLLLVYLLAWSAEIHECLRQVDLKFCNFDKNPQNDYWIVFKCYFGFDLCLNLS